MNSRKRLSLLSLIVFSLIFLNVSVCEPSWLDVIKNLVRKGVTETAEGGAARQAGKKSSENIASRSFGGSSIILAERLGISRTKDLAAHHIIPVELKNHRALAKIGMDMDEVSNGIALPMKPGLDPRLPLHRGSHPAYTAAVARDLDAIPPNLSVEESRAAVKAIQDKYRNLLQEGRPLHETYGATNPWY